jgi:hypothetical protein
MLPHPLHDYSTVLCTSLLLELYFHFDLVWDLLLGLVGLL